VSYTGTMLEYEISPAESAELILNGKARLLDVREPWEFNRASIEGSLLMPMGDVPSRANQELDPDEHLIVVCHLGQRSLAVTAWLRKEGFDNVQSMRGGIEAWSLSVDPSIPRY
jgi:rhodanese-related sulfurtransferase